MRTGCQMPARDVGRRVAAAGRSAWKAEKKGLEGGTALLRGRKSPRPGSLVFFPRGTLSLGIHAHLIVEAHGKEALACGMKSIGARLARAVNRVGQRSGPVLDGRYHHRSLRSPREVRRALAYVLLNARRHLAKCRGVSRSATAHLDGASSARWFDGWRPEVASRIQVSSSASEVARPRTWLLRTGWRRHGLIDPSEVPGEAA